MGVIRSFTGGMGFFLQGLRWVARHPGWWLFGLIPALIVFVLYAVGLYFLGTSAGDLAGWLTPFADGWDEGLRNTFRIMVGVVVFGAGLVLAVVTFAAVTLVVGEPFYEKLSEQVERTYGEVPTGHELPLWRSIPRSIKDSLVTLAYVLLFTVPLFFLGFVPVIGQTVVPVLGAMVSGFFLTVELTALAMERRGLARRSRFALLRGDKALALGFGVLLFLLFLIPLGAVVAMPAAVAGAAIMVRTRLAAGGPPAGNTPRQAFPPGGLPPQTPPGGLPPRSSPPGPPPGRP
ncbi:EI24 domain-containing protein [Planomonospora sp. ID91781]|uniref:Sulfate transporter n=1 Tax=Planomonospora sphaerica TaxID=161355 RepID=A0A171DGH8_9ACTN|nr:MULTISPECIES: EI24 domain-containing protein [Planomonospora]MBG0824719.1 EI24 domain-containing protein [Planomonospora sp. ID91781]GAT68358.1 sulfate transporter [Planomonospora sphaerica]